PQYPPYGSPVVRVPSGPLRTLLSLGSFNQRLAQTAAAAKGRGEGGATHQLETKRARNGTSLSSSFSNSSGRTVLRYATSDAAIRLCSVFSIELSANHPAFSIVTIAPLSIPRRRRPRWFRCQ